jgi:Ca2+-binding RTX toxin-like protein
MGLAVTISGSGYIEGSEANDVILGSNQPDVIVAKGGNDTICAGNGLDSVFGGSGNDVVFGPNGDDSIQGGDGLDALSGDDGNDSITGGGGNDTINGVDGDDRIDGGDEDDQMSGGNGNDTLDGETGTNAGDGGAGTDTCFAAVVSGCEVTVPGEATLLPGRPDGLTAEDEAMFRTVVPQAIFGGVTENTDGTIVVLAIGVVPNEVRLALQAIAAEMGRALLVEPATYTRTALEQQRSVFQGLFDRNEPLAGRRISGVGFTGDEKAVSVSLENAAGAELAALQSQYPNTRFTEAKYTPIFGRFDDTVPLTAGSNITNYFNADGTISGNSNICTVSTGYFYAGSLGYATAGHCGNAGQWITTGLRADAQTIPTGVPLT